MWLYVIFVFHMTHMISMGLIILTTHMIHMTINLAGSVLSRIQTDLDFLIPQQKNVAKLLQA